MQVEPIKPTLKAPGTKRLKLKYDELLSNVAVKFDLRCYTVDQMGAVMAVGSVTYLGAATSSSSIYTLVS